MRKIFLFFSVLLLLGSAVKAQVRTVSGVVTGDKGETLPGVTIKVKGGATGTQTDVDGKYSIKVTSLQSVVISATYVGYAYQEKALKIGEMNADFKLVASTNNLDEVVVVGYGEQKKITLTGSVATVDIKKIADNPQLNLATALAGTMPGVSVAGGNQRPGQPTAITVRNPVSYAKDPSIGTTPLYVIDDVIRTPADFNLLDASQVESLSVLKDAEAAIYGIQGANGVIVVRTKRGHSGAPKVELSTSLTTNSARKLPVVLNGLQLATLSNDYNQTTASQGLNAATGQPNFYDASGYLNGDQTKTRLAGWYTPDELAYFGQPENNHDYLSQAFKTALAQREAVSVSGGNDKVNYFIGADYVNQSSNFSGVNSNKLGLRANIDAHPAKGLTTSLSLSQDVYNSRSFWYKFNGENLDNDVTSLVQVTPWSQYFINGLPVLLNSATSGSKASENNNVFLFQNSNNYTSTTNNIMNYNAKVTYEIPGVKGLTAGVTYNNNINSGYGKQYGTSFNYYTFSNLGDNHHIPGGTATNLTNPVVIKNGDKVSLSPLFAKKYQLDATLNYNGSFGKNKISALAIYEQRATSQEGVYAEVSGVIPTGKDNMNFTTGTPAANQANGQVSTYGYVSYIGRVNYSYDDKYLVQASIRADGTSDFLPGLNFGYFPSASAGWIASKEKFVQDNLKFFDLLKFRASVGLLGSDNTKGYQYYANYKYGTGSGGGAVFGGGKDRTFGVAPNIVLANSGITWDHTTKTDYGIDMEFLNHRLTASVDYYWNHGYDLLTTLTSSVPSTVGAPLPPENNNITNTFGYEISLGWRDKIGKDFSYNINPFFTWSDDKLIKYDVPPGLVGTFRDLTGKSDDPGVLGFQNLGIIRTKEQADAIIAERQAAAGGPQNVKIGGQAIKDANGIYHLGMLNYVDVDGNGVIDDNDIKYLTKKASNHYSLGFNFGFNYKSFSLSFITGLSWGGMGNIGGAELKTGDVIQNKPVFWADHYSPSNVNAKYPDYYYVNNSSLSYTSDFWFVSSFQWNITNANLSYTLPTKWSNKIGLSSIRAYCNGNNLLSLFNPYPDHYRDPSSTVTAYPSLREITFGLNIGI